MIKFILIVISLSQSVNGQSTSSDGCYQVYPNSKVNCVNSYTQQPVSNEQQCRDLCSKGSPQCQAAQYSAGSQQCELYNTFVPVGQAGRRRKRDFHNLFLREKRQGSYHPTYVGGGVQTYRPAPAPASYPAPRPSYGPAPASYPAPKPNYGPAPASYPAPKPNYGPAPAPKPSYGGGAACGGYGPTVQGVDGYTYCRPTGTCMGAQTTPPPVTQPPSECPTGQVLRYYQATGFHIQGTPDFTFNTDSDQACMAACTANQQPTGTAAMCKSADYNTQTKQCQVYTSQTFPPIGSAAAAADPNFNHYEKVCVDATLGGRCQGPFFLGPQMILIGYAQSVTTASSEIDCLNLCANSQSRFGFNCLSGMFYFQETTNNCILNSESRTTHPDLYNPENQDKVNYFEPGCQSARFLRSALSATRNRNVIQLDQPDFGPWTLCDKQVLGHKRFKGCSSFNPNKCSRDENICDPKKEDEYDLQIVKPIKPGQPGAATTLSPVGGGSVDESHVTEIVIKETAFQQVHARDSGHSQHGPVLPSGKCFPLVNLDGTKDCEHGTMITPGGKRTNCVPTFQECKG